MKKLVRNFKGIVFVWKKLNFKSELKNVIIILTYRSGSAADTQAMTDIVKNQLEWYEIEFGNPPPVHTAAHLFKNISYDYRDQLTAGLIIAGWDKDNGGQVYSVSGLILLRRLIYIKFIYSEKTTKFCEIFT